MINIYIGISGLVMGLVSIIIILLSSKKIEKLNQDKSVNFDNRNVLVVDDNKLNLVVLKGLLKKTSYVDLHFIQPLSKEEILGYKEVLEIINNSYLFIRKNNFKI